MAGCIEYTVDLIGGCRGYNSTFLFSNLLAYVYIKFVSQYQISMQPSRPDAV